MLPADITKIVFLYCKNTILQIASQIYITHPMYYSLTSNFVLLLGYPSATHNFHVGHTMLPNLLFLMKLHEIKLHKIQMLLFD